MKKKIKIQNSNQFDQKMNVRTDRQRSKMKRIQIKYNGMEIFDEQ